MARIKSAEYGYTYETKCDLAVISCGVCGIPFALSEALNKRALAHPDDSSQTVYFYCPAGHKLRYGGRSQEDKLRDRLAGAENRANFNQHEAEQARASAAAHKGAATKARKERDRILHKVKHGICPVKGCGRSFKDVRRHIAGQHPDFDVPEND